jgi:hypothetical protein
MRDNTGGGAMTAGIGHNNPPDPFAAHETHILDLMELADGCLTGGKIDTPEKAAAIDELLESIKDATKALEVTRKAENKPFDDGKAAVQAKAKPLATKLELAKEIAAKALTPWRLKLQAEKDAEQQRLQDEAIRLADEARAKFTHSAPTDLSARIEAEEIAKRAKKAEAIANKIDRSATGLRTYHVATVTDYPAFLGWLKINRPHELKAWLSEQAQRECNSGQRAMAGVLVEQEKRVA